MTINATTKSPAALATQLGVPWSTLLPLAAVMAYADGFWIVSLRGAVGSIERTQNPFTSWLRESTLALPLFVLAVLGAVTLALRLFGPRPHTAKTLPATAALIIAAGTLAGSTQMAASSAYDYHLQFNQLQLMHAMDTTCAGASCLPQLQHASLALQIHAVGAGALILLVTNLVLVGWVTALKGGRLNLATTRTRIRPAGNRAHDLHLLLAAGLLGATAIHAAVVPEHLTQWGPAGVFFIALVAAELIIAATLTRPHPQPRVLLAAAAASIGPLALWLYSRTAGIPFGPGAGTPEPLGLADLAASALEATTLLIALTLLRRTTQLQHQPPTPAHTRWLTLTTIITATTIGLAATPLPWLDTLANTTSHTNTHTNQPVLHATTPNNTTTS
jgi:hypothetical protein